MSIFIKLHAMANSTYSLGYNSSILMYDISVHGRQDWKVSAKIFTLEVRQEKFTANMQEFIMDITCIWFGWLAIK